MVTSLTLGSVTSMSDCELLPYEVKLVFVTVDQDLREATIDAVKAFSKALRFGLIGSEPCTGVFPIRQPTDDTHGDMCIVQFMATHLSDDVIGILGGMLIARNLFSRSLSNADLQTESCIVNLLDRSSLARARPTPEGIRALPLRGPTESCCGAPPARITIEFFSALSVSDYLNLRMMLECWLELAIGGFAPLSEPIGSSWVDATDITLMHPAIIEIYTDGFHVGESAIAALIQGLSQIVTKHPIQLVEIELQ
jgi:hypothetical protein